MKRDYNNVDRLFIVAVVWLVLAAGIQGVGLARKTPSVTDTLTISGSNNLADRINAADSELGEKAGKIVVLTSGDITKTVRLAPHHTLAFASGVWKFSADSGIEVSSYSRVTGNGVGETTLTLTNPDGSLIISSDYNELHNQHQNTVLHPDLESAEKDAAGKNTGSHFLGAKLITISDLTLSGVFQKGDKPGTATGIRIYGFWFRLNNILVENFSGPGIVTEYVSSGYTKGNDAAESFVNDVKIMNNGGDGWVVRGSHDTMVNGLISALNGRWGLDVQHNEGYFSGGGLMLSNVHAYGNTLGGVRTQSGANILAFGLESEANHGPGVLLRSNDNVIRGEFYTNKTYGIQIGDGSSYSGANLIEAQLHNNGEAQIYFDKSAGYNLFTGVIYASGKQKYVLGAVTADDVLNTVVGGLSHSAVAQQFQGKVVIDNKGNVSGIRSLGGSPAGEVPNPRNSAGPNQVSSAATLSVVLKPGVTCIPASGVSAHVSWAVRSKAIANVKVTVANPHSDRSQLFSSGGKVGGADTGQWVRPGTKFELLNSATGALLATYTVSSAACKG